MLYGNYLKDNHQAPPNDYLLPWPGGGIVFELLLWWWEELQVIEEKFRVQKKGEFSKVYFY